jgi:hypothetical protein
MTATTALRMPFTEDLAPLKETGSGFIKRTKYKQSTERIIECRAKQSPDKECYDVMLHEVRHVIRQYLVAPPIDSESH